MPVESPTASRTTSAGSPPTVRQRRRAGHRWRGALVAASLLLAALAARPLRAQRPDAHWRTLDTPHFRVHFAPETEAIARHAAASAEWAYAALARELVPPRGLIELVVSDDADFSNGYTTTFPTNRVVVYTQPPVDDPELRDYDDWITLVVTHELTHVFHLDRSRGIWAGLQHVFGRNPWLFPSSYEPRWVSEGLAVYYESRITGAGRIVGTGHRAVARAAALGNRSPRIGDLSVARSTFPGGENVYIFGSLIFDELSRSCGPDRIRRYIEKSSAYILPFQLDRTSRSAFCMSFARALRAVRDSVVAGADSAREPLAGWRPLTPAFDQLVAPRVSGDGITFGGDMGREMPGAYEVDSAGHVRRLGRRTGASVNLQLSDGAILTSQLEFTSPYEIRSDLYVQRGRRLHRLTHGQRLSSPDARGDREIVAVQSLPGTTILALVSRDGRVVRPLTAASPDTQWAQPRWSIDGRRIAAVKLFTGNRSQIVVLDTTGAQLGVVADEQGSVSASPAWDPLGHVIYFTSDRSGVAELYAAPAPGEESAFLRLSNARTALADPLPILTSATTASITAAHLGARGWTLGTGTPLALPPDGRARSAGRAAPSAERPGSDSSAAHPYHAFRQLVPRYWLPLFYADNDSTTVFSAMTSGSDVVGRHAYEALAAISPRWSEKSGAFDYRWAGLGMPVVALAASQAWDGGGFVVDKTSGALLGSVRRRTRTLSAGLGWSRPRTRYALAANLAGGVESRDFAIHPESLRAAIGSDYLDRTHRRPFAVASLAAANTQSPRRSISAENGLSAFVAGERLRDPDERNGGHTRAVASLAGYRALSLPGYAHHVLALRVAGGWSDSEDPSEFSVGGAESELLALRSTTSSGTSDFPLRGWISGALTGTRALAGSLEYRAPLVVPNRGLGILFFDRASATAFADAARSWCAGAVALGCRDGHTLASAGAELVVDIAIFYDAPLTLRLGAAKSLGPLAGGTLSSDGAYLALGRSF